MEKHRILESGQKIYNMSLTYLVAPERKEHSKKIKQKAHNYGDCVTEHKDSERPKWEQYEHLVLDHAKV